MFLSLRWLSQPLYPLPLTITLNTPTILPFPTVLATYMLCVLKRHVQIQRGNKVNNNIDKLHKGCKISLKEFAEISLMPMMKSW